jgi:hypothetical protein
MTEDNVVDWRARTAGLKAAGYLGTGSISRGPKGRNDVKEFNRLFCRCVADSPSTSSSSSSASAAAAASAATTAIGAARSEAQGLAGCGGVAFTLACQPGFLPALVAAMERFPRDVAVQREGSAAIEALSRRMQVGGKGFSEALAAETTDGDYAGFAAALGVAPPLLMKQEQAQADPAYALWLAGKVQLMTRRRLVEAGARRVLEDVAMQCPGGVKTHPRRALDYLLYGDVVNRALKMDAPTPCWTYEWSLWWASHFQTWCRTVKVHLVEFECFECRSEGGEGRKKEDENSPSSAKFYQILTGGEFPVELEGTWRSCHWCLLDQHPDDEEDEDEDEDEEEEEEEGEGRGEGEGEKK